MARRHIDIEGPRGSRDDLNDEPRPTFRVVLVGNSMVGKTSIMVRACFDRFSLSAESATVGAEHFYRALTVDDREIMLEIWDTAGQERYRSLAPLYYRKAAGALAVYDVTNRDSYLAALQWAQEIRERVLTLNVIILVGNKLDLVAGTRRRTVTTSEAEQYAEQRNMLFIETSAMSGTNVAECLNLLGRELLMRNDENRRLEQYRRPSNNGVRLPPPPVNEPRRPDCCNR